MQIIVETLCGKKHTLEVAPADTIEDVKNQIAKLEGITITNYNMYKAAKLYKSQFTKCIFD